EYEYFVKWDPDNTHDESIKGYTGRCFIDCYKLEGTLVWRLDMGQNIRAGALFTQFMVYVFNGDGRAEMAVLSTPVSVLTRF
ncbi:UNVERIFIED_CONTAM: rhamnogalacturonan lyase, partial [Bacteroidetes bacterium 56_B9]